jgi:heptosyltransferase III
VRLLFIKLKHHGDALLLTPTLAAARACYPSAEIWVVVRRGSEGILAGCPAIDRVLASAAPESSGRKTFDWVNDLKLLREIRRQYFDHAFEFTQGDRGRLLTAWSGARFRCASNGVYRVPIFWRPWFNRLSTHDWRNEHQVEANFHLVNEFLPLGVSEPPPLVFERARTKPCDLGVKLTDYIVIHPGTRWQRKRWPLEKWIETGRELLKLAAQLVISVGPDADEVQLGDALAGALGPQAVSTRGQLSWAQLAGLLYGAKLFVGLDTAAMHLAAACQCPTVALFGSSVARHWRPWRAPHQLIGAADWGQKAADDTMTRIAVEPVLAACRAMLSK